MNMIKKQNAITLVALVITIIILLILAGVTITSLGNGGFFARSQSAKESQQNAQDLENERLQGYENVLNEYYRWKK